MTPQTRAVVHAVVGSVFTLAVALGPFALSQVWVHTHHHHQSTTGPRAGEMSQR